MKYDNTATAKLQAELSRYMTTQIEKSDARTAIITAAVNAAIENLEWLKNSGRKFTKRDEDAFIAGAKQAAAAAAAFAIR